MSVRDFRTDCPEFCGAGKCKNCFPGQARGSNFFASLSRPTRFLCVPAASSRSYAAVDVAASAPIWNPTRRPWAFYQAGLARPTRCSGWRPRHTAICPNFVRPGRRKRIKPAIAAARKGFDSRAGFWWKRFCVISERKKNCNGKVLGASWPFRPGLRSE